MRLLALLAAFFLGFAGMGMLLGFPVAIERRPRPSRESRVDRRRRWLRQAGARVSVTQFYAVAAASGLGAFSLLYIVTGAWVVSIVPAVLCALTPQLYYTQLRKRRLAAVNQAWPDGLRDLMASANQQLPLHQAILALSRGGPSALRQAFSTYPANARALGVIPALEHIKEELADPTSDRVLEVLILAADRGSGGDLLGRLLGDLALSMTADLRTEEEIDTARQEPRINMAVAASLPWLLLLGMCLVDTPQRDYYASGRGLIPVAISAAMTFFGIAAVRALSRDPVESRLFVTEETASD